VQRIKRGEMGRAHPLLDFPLVTFRALLGAHDFGWIGHGWSDGRFVGTNRMANKKED
jgi:hypothetical protein